jgi:3-hydroxyisobutyrate dehydrogenase-like beta-hydroxyacid dehydrogenase
MAMEFPFTLIGFGEAGSTFACAGEWCGRAMGWDILAERRAAMPDCGVEPASSAAAALADAKLALSLVTADAAQPVARECAAAIAPDTLWCDMNSIAPQTKQQAAQAIEDAGGRYVDVAILAPVNPAKLDVPLLLAGVAAEEAAQMLAALGFTNIRAVGEDVGRASAIKMVRSVMVKGIEALTDEMMAAASLAGITDEVLASLDASERQIGWAERAAYNLERMETHGHRRAAEMEEVARTLSGFGVEPLMTSGTIARQRAAGKRGAEARKEKAA